MKITEKIKELFEIGMLIVELIGENVCYWFECVFE